MRWRAGIVIASMGALVIQGTGCAKAPPPRTAPEPQVPLEVPVPPPRVLGPVAPDVAEAQEAAGASGVATAPPSSPSPAAAAGGSRAPQRPSTAAGGGATGPAPAEAVRGPEVEPAQPTLRTPQTANDAETEGRIRDVLARAARGLEAVSLAQLTADARSQFETARRFIGQATDALSARNYMFAAYLADKAETLARGLAGR